MKYQSLRKKKEIEELFKTGRGKKSGFLLLKFMPSADGETKVAVIVSKKISKLAVARNRNKRKVRAALQIIDFKPGFSYAIIVLQNIGEINQREVEKDVAMLMAARKRPLDTH